MKKLLALLPLLLWVLPCCAQLPYVPIRLGAGASSSGTTTCHLAGSGTQVNSGDLLIAAMAWFGSSNPPSISDTLSSTWTLQLSYLTPSIPLAIYTGIAGGTGIETITITVSGASFENISCADITIAGFTNTLDVSCSTATNCATAFSGTPATPSSPSITTTVNNDLIICYAGGFRSGGVFGIQTGSIATDVPVNFSNGADSQGMFYYFAGNAGSNNCTFTNATNDQGTVAIVALQASSIAIQSPAALPDGALSNAYKYTELATGGVGSYTWSISSGSLPSGLSINSSTGAITGTPTTSNNYSFTVQVTDGTHTATKSSTIKVTTGLNTPTVVQTKGCASNGNCASLLFASNVTSGNLIVANVGWLFGTTMTPEYCTDGVGTPFQLLFWEFNNVGPMGWFAGFAPTSGSDTVTCHSSSSTNAVQGIYEISNVQYFGNDNLLTPATQGSTASPATITSGSITTLVPNEMLLSAGWAFTNAATMAIQAPFTGIQTGWPTTGGYDAVSSVTTYTSSYSMASNTANAWVISMIGFRPASNGTVTPPPGFPMVIKYQKKIPWDRPRRLVLERI
jgi:hypothetical protein